MAVTVAGVFAVAAIFFIFVISACFVRALEAGYDIHGPVRAAGRRFCRRDVLALGIITVCYTATAFTGLGDTAAPQSFCKFTARGQYALIELSEPTTLGGIVYYTGLHTGAYRLEFSFDGENWVDQPEMEQSYADLFKWIEAELNEEQEPVRCLRITADSCLWLGELALYDAEGGLIPSDSLTYSGGTAALFDEQDTIPESPGYLNSTYFDEIYHARTAYENVQNVYPYEITHPPLGKLIIAAGIKLFGMTPFGWRFSGTLFGAAMLPVIYMLLKRLFGGTAVPACCTVIFAFDFMHFVQTRIATIDTYAVFFILLMYLFMYIYLRTDKGKARRGWRLPLALCGISFGIGCACKWTCIYAGAGLAVLWLLDRIFRARRGCGAKEAVQNILWCLVFFVAVPLGIYYVSYWPYGTSSCLSAPSMFFSREYLDIVTDNNKYMFSYHSGISSAHPYSSRWYEWVLDIRPILYYLEYDGDMRSSFGAFLNPLVCWMGLAAMLFMVYLVAARRDKRALFILVGYLAQLVPWVFVTRTTYEYHYFPSMVFLVLAIGRVFAEMRDHLPRWRRPVFGFTAACTALFVMFYPVLSGAWIPARYGAYFLKWLPRWPF